MKKRIVNRLSRVKRAGFAATGMAALALPILLGIVHPNARAQVQPQFEVASIKPNASNSRTTRTIEHGTLTYVNITLGEFIQLAYGIRPVQLSSTDSVIAHRYDMIAKASEPVSDDQVKLMLQALLAERFKLAFHREKKEFAVFDLVVARGGPRLTPTIGDHPPSTLFPSATALSARNSTMSDLVRLLSSLPSIGRPVMDRTGLTAAFDYDLKFDSVLKNEGANADSPKTGVMNLLDAAALPAIAELGLRLESQKALLDVMIVDHIEPPSAN